MLLSWPPRRKERCKNLWNDWQVSSVVSDNGHILWYWRVVSNLSSDLSSSLIKAISDSCADEFRVKICTMMISSPIRHSWLDTRHISHVTRLMSLIAGHTSHFTCRTSLLTRHTSLPRHTSLVTPTSHATQHTSPTQKLIGKHFIVLAVVEKLSIKQF